MSMANVSFKEMREEALKKGGFEPHPAGTFTMKVSETQVKRGNSGSSQILTTLETIDEGPDKGRTLLNNMAFRKNDGDLNGMFFQQLGALGFGEGHPLFDQIEQSAQSEDQAVAMIAGAILGASAVVEVNHREWQGSMRDNVKRMVPVGSAAPTGRVGGPPVVAQFAAGQVAGVAPAPVVPAAPAPVAAPPVAAPVAPAPAPAPVAPAPAPAAPTLPVAPVAAQEATPAPTTEAAVVAQFPTASPAAPAVAPETPSPAPAPAPQTLPPPPAGKPF